MSKCHIAYEISIPIKSLNTRRKVVVDTRAEARKTKAKWPDAVLQVVEMCNGKIKRRGKRVFEGRRRSK
jgi:hypothetical protein